MKDENKKIGRPKKENALSNAERQKKFIEKKKKKESEKIEIKKVIDLLLEMKKEYEEKYLDRKAKGDTEGCDIFYRAANVITMAEIRVTTMIKKTKVLGE